MSYKTRAINGIVIAGSLVIMSGIAQNADIAAMETVTAETQGSQPARIYAGIVADLSLMEENVYDNATDANAGIGQLDATLVGTAQRPFAGVAEELMPEGPAIAGTVEGESAVAGSAAEVFAEAEEVSAPEEPAVNGTEENLSAVTGEETVTANAVAELPVTGESAAAEEMIVAAAEESTPQMIEEELAWENRLMADVNEFLYIRAEGNEDAQILGKLYKGDVAEIVEYGEEWTHVTSGNVDGYVMNSYCLFGADALAYATETFDMEAQIQTNGLRVRSEASEDARVLTSVSTGMTLTVDTDAEEVDGWVAVIYKGDTAYVSAEYVTTELALGEAVTLEEEREAQARAAAEAAAAAAAQVPSPGTVQNEAVSASVDDVTLLAALIQCEAGSEPYEGQVAVGAVVMNRVRSGGYPNSVYGVIYQSGQFSPARSGSVARVAANGPKASCIQAAQEALAGVDNTGGATCFRPASSGRAGVLIGNQVFW